MSTLRVASDLASVLVPVGVFGAVLAGLCAIVAGVAIARGAGGLSGGAVGVWIPFAMLSSTAGFASQWVPLVSSGAVLAAMLIGGGVLRAFVNSAEMSRATRPVRAEVAAADAPQVEVARVDPAPAEAPVRAPVPAAVPAPVPAAVATPVRTGVGAAITETVSTLTRPNPARAA